MPNGKLAYVNLKQDIDIFSYQGMEMLMRYFVGTELGVVNLLQRRFCWTANSLWFEEIPDARDYDKTLFLLGGKDDIVNPEVIYFS